MRRTAERLCLILIVVVAIGAFVLSSGGGARSSIIALPVVAAFVRVRLPPRASHLLIWFSRLAIALAAMPTDDFTWPMGLTVSLFACVFLTDTVAFPPGRALLPAVCGVLVAAAQATPAPHFPPLA